MQCPVCRMDMVIVEFHDVELDMCIDGHGVWFDGDELRQLFEIAAVPEGLHDLESKLETLPHADEHGPRRHCPRCLKRMDHVQAPGKAGPVVLDRCEHGHGLWFDEGELNQILASELAEDAEAFVRIKEFLGQFAAPDAAEEPKQT